MKLIIETDLQIANEENTIKDLENTLSYMLPVIVEKAHGYNPLSFSEQFSTIEKYLEAAEMTMNKADVKIQH